MIKKTKTEELFREFNHGIAIWSKWVTGKQALPYRQREVFLLKGIFTNDCMIPRFADRLAAVHYAKRWEHARETGQKDNSYLMTNMMIDSIK